MHDWLPFKMQNDTKQKQTNVKSVSVSVHSMLIYVKNKGNDSIFFQKDLEGIEYMRTFANVIKRVTPHKSKEQNKLVDFSYRFLVFRF